jgi:hypothetical protein
MNAQLPWQFKALRVDLDLQRRPTRYWPSFSSEILWPEGA